MESNKPKVPAQQGWQQMKELLNKEMPVAKTSNSKRYISILALLLLIGSCGIYKMYNNNNNNNEKSISSNESVVSTNATSNSNVPSANTSNSLSKNIIANKDNNSDLLKNEIDNNHKNIIENKIVENAKVENETSKTTNEIVRKNLVKANSINAFKENISIVYSKNTSDKNIKVNSKTKFTNKPFNTSSNQLINQSTNQLVSSSNIQPINLSTNLSLLSNNILTKKSLNNIIVNNLASNTSIPVPTTPKKKLNLSYGLQFNFPITYNTSSFMDKTANNNPLLSILPSVFLSKNLNNKSSIKLIFNPYAQYFLNNQIANNYKYNLSSESASGAYQTSNELIQNISLKKLIGVELSALYQYQIFKKFNVSVGLSNTWLNTAIYNNHIQNNKKESVKDEWFAINNSRPTWQQINSNFLNVKMGLGYQFKNMEFGVNVQKPLSTISKQVDVSPINAQLYLNYNLK